MERFVIIAHVAHISLDAFNQNNGGKGNNLRRTDIYNTVKNENISLFSQTTVPTVNANNFS